MRTLRMVVTNNLTVFEDMTSWDDLYSLASVETLDLGHAITLTHEGPPLETVEIYKTVAVLEAEINPHEPSSHSGVIPEILRRIFELGLTNLITYPKLSLISQSWRKVVLDTPMLWAYITLNQTSQIWNVRPFLVDIDCRYVDRIIDILDIMLLLEPHLHRRFSFRVLGGRYGSRTESQPKP
ncbi:hypothetical protein BDM02DRAFT_3183813 [Thelephora ganbajun]|uniref:Uncharacterized protein n=1 Tax=Thelephora ganbajun TaxID=370292 RepID=A0ACB6ZT09_THEGA|nr:hypothetical protein BDM02DRAFT_3183813 [Thelephora ganbajun]